MPESQRRRLSISTLSNESSGIDPANQWSRRICMNRNSVNRLLTLSCTVALASVVSACNGDRASSNQARGREGAPINLTGCLQKGGGLTSSYVLTQVNEPTRSVGTSGSSQPDVVKQDQR